MILNSFRWRVGVIFLLTALLAACSSGPRNQAPVEDRNSLKTPQAAPAPVAAKVEVEKVLPGAENAGKPGYYTVRQGDTLTRIGLDHGHAWRDLAKWNNLDNPNLIETGQVIRVAPPGALVESAGVELARGLMARFTAVDEVLVRVRKLTPPIPERIGAVGIELRLTRDEFARDA